MAQAVSQTTTSRFHNLSNEALADALGHADASVKGAEAECKALKDEFKRRGLTEVAGCIADRELGELSDTAVRIVVRFAVGATGGSRTARLLERERLS